MIKNKKNTKLNVTYDVLWKNRSSGRQCNSISSHAFIISHLPKALIGMLVYSKFCRMCNKTEKRGEESTYHILQQNLTEDQIVWGVNLFYKWLSIPSYNVALK